MTAVCADFKSSTLQELRTFARRLRCAATHSSLPPFVHRASFTNCSGVVPAHAKTWSEKKARQMPTLLPEPASHEITAMIIDHDECCERACHFVLLIVFAQRQCTQRCAACRLSVTIADSGKPPLCVDDDGPEAWLAEATCKDLLLLGYVVCMLSRTQATRLR